MAVMHATKLPYQQQKHKQIDYSTQGNIKRAVKLYRR